MTSPSSSNPAGPQPYWCFISYRHADNKQLGRQWATWLHQQIETYEVPGDLVGTTNGRGEEIPERIFPVFRDEEELPADADLGSPIYRALDRSLFLLVLCSPQAVQSTYVADEILYFKKQGKSGRVLAALLEGEPNASWDEGKRRAGVDAALECFPEPLQYLLDDAGELDRSRRAEPIAADFRLPDGTQGWTSPEAYRQALSGSQSRSKIEAEVRAYQARCELARLKIIAGILGVPLGELTRRDKAYQLEKERRRARVFRHVASAMGVLALLAAALGIFALQKRQEAETNQKSAEAATKVALENQERAELAEGEAKSNQMLAEEATEVAVQNQERAELAEDQAKQNLERATELLWEASYNAWNEAERSYAAGDPQGALAYLAGGMRNAPENVGLVSFATCLLGEVNYPLRTLNFELPVCNVAYVRGKEELIVAELLYSEATRYSLWDPLRVEQLDEALLPRGQTFSAEELEQQPWLASAPRTRWSNNSEVDQLEPTYSSSGMRLLEADYERVFFRGEGISWTHPWFGYDGESGQPRYELPNSSWATGYAWNRDGGRIASSHGFIDEVSEQQRGRVCIWDLRQPLGITLLPEETIGFDEIEVPEEWIEEDGEYRVHYVDSGLEFSRIDADARLWSFPYDKDQLNLALFTFGELNEVVLVSGPTARYDDVQELEQPIRLRFERRALSDGKLLASATAELGQGLSAANSPAHLVRHPSGQGFAYLNDAFILSWDGTNQAPRGVPSPGPADRLGWAGSLIFAPQGDALMVGTHRKLMRLSWPELELQAGPRYHDTIVSALAVNDEGTRLISAAGFGDGAGSAGYAQLWSLPELEPIGPRLVHASQVGLVEFVGSGRAFVSSSESPEGSEIRLWDARTALPLTHHLTPPAGSGQAFIVFDAFEEGELSTLRAKGQVDAYGDGSFTTRIPTPKQAVPAWFHAHFLPLAAGRKLTAEGTLEKLTIPELRAHLAALNEQLASTPASEEDVYGKLARWYLADASSRNVSAFSDLSVDEFLETHYFRPAREGDPRANPAGAMQYDPRHPLLHLHMALTESDPARQLYFSRWGTALLGRPFNAETYGRERWVEQLRTGKALLERMGKSELAEALQRVLDGA